MKRQGNLWPSIVSFESLDAAARRSLRGKRNRPGAAAFFLDLESQLFALQGELESGTYRPGPYRNFWIQDPKPRLISAAPFRDRVVHHALAGAIEPRIERRLMDHVYACRRGRGQHRALVRFVEHARRYRYVLMMDIEKYFASIDHQVLFTLLRKLFKDERVLALCERIVSAGAGTPPGPVRFFPGDHLLSPLAHPRGLPIGNLTSQLFANLMLDPIDHLATDQLGLTGYLRYMDDFACFSNDREELIEARRRIREELLYRRMRFQERKSRVRRTDERLTFLGFTICGTPWPDSKDVTGAGFRRSIRLKLAPATVRRWRRNSKLVSRLHCAGDISAERAQATLEGWRVHASQGECDQLMRRVGADWLD